LALTAFASRSDIRSFWENELASVQLVNVTKRFGDTLVIDDLSMTVAANEFMVFLGPSGCGKSTLLRMIAGLETVDEGQILIGDRRVDQLPPGQRDVAMVFQHYALYPHMTIRENMSFGLRNVGVDRAEIARRVEAAAAMLEIDGLLDRRPTQLSGGQRQRVAIGRAIVKQPKLFLFDEPLSNLDAALRARTRVELAQLHQRMQATMIFVTHDQVEAMTLADRIMLMSTRKIEQVGTPMEIYMRPATAFVASFVGSPKINFLTTNVTAGEEGYAAAALPGGGRIETRIVAADLPPGETFQLGVRAEEIEVVGPELGELRGVAEVVERLGDRTFIHTRLAAGSLVVAVDSGDSTVAVGEAVGLNLAKSRVHLFDQEGRGYHAAAASGRG
jgi:multiple sugar transport system ATP-binding protein